MAEAGDYLLQVTLVFAMVEDGDTRWQENYLYVNSTKILDVRTTVKNLTGDYEYYTCSGSRIYPLAAGDVLKLQGNGQMGYQLRQAYGSNLLGIRLG